MKRSAWFVCIFLLLPAMVFSQFESNYLPLGTYDSHSKELLKTLEERFQIQYGRMRYESPLVLEEFDNITSYLKETARRGNFLKDNALEGFVNQVYQRILQSNSFTCTPGNVLIQRNPYVNAACFGQGTIAINVTLLARLETEGELAFILAHELAHYELDHVRLKVIENLNSGVRVKGMQVVRHVQKGKVTVGELEEMRDLMYASSRFSRFHEMQADSLGFRFFRLAGYNEVHAVNLLKKLQKLEQREPPIGISLFESLDAPKYRFQETWIHDRPSVYKTDDMPDSFLFVRDSTESHPDIETRMSKLEKYEKSFPDISIDYDDSVDLEARRNFHVAEFESVGASLRFPMYDRSLYYALKLKMQYPSNKYLNISIGRILTDLLITKDVYSRIYLVPKKSNNYGEDLTRVSNLLNNLSYYELGEIAFNFLNRSSNFDGEEEELYYLLWKACGLTGRLEVQKSVKEAYVKKFGKGCFGSKMKNHLLNETYFESFPDR